jgi:hypothetical protein
MHFVADRQAEARIFDPDDLASDREDRPVAHERAGRHSRGVHDDIRA